MVSRTTRFYNLIIDSFFYFITVCLLILMLRNLIEKDQLKWLLIAYYYLYYLVGEGIFGQTIGKWFTKTQVVTVNKSSNLFMSVILRTLLRIVPIDWISYLFNTQGIHDKYSKTELIRKS